MVKLQWLRQSSSRSGVQLGLGTKVWSFIHRIRLRPSTTGSAVSLTAACEGIQYGNIPQSNEPTTPSVCHQLAVRRYLKVNPTYVGENADTNCSSDLGAPNPKEFEVPPDQIDTLDLQAKLHALPFCTRFRIRIMCQSRRNPHVHPQARSSAL
jgi:hypothetical protein